MAPYEELAVAEYVGIDAATFAGFEAALVDVAPFGVVALPRLPAILRHARPRLVEATVVPLVLFYLSLWLVGRSAALPRPPGAS